MQAGLTGGTRTAACRVSAVAPGDQASATREAEAIIEDLSAIMPTDISQKGSSDELAFGILLAWDRKPGVHIFASTCAVKSSSDPYPRFAECQERRADAVTRDLARHRLARQYAPVYRDARTLTSHENARHVMASGGRSLRAQREAERFAEPVPA